MKIEVAKRDLEAALGVASIAAASTGSDITTHFVFRYNAEDNVVEVLANNNRIGASMPMICDTTVSDDTNAFTVESWRLNKWITAVQDAALILQLTEGQVKATSPKGSVKFPSLDAKAFPYWDETFKEAVPGIKVQAKRLQAALTHARLFISDKDTTAPHLAVTEIKHESLQATDKGALAVITFYEQELVKQQGEENEGIKKTPLFAGSNLRIHGKDLGHVLSFLSSCGEEPVEIREHKKATFLIREDGGMLTVGRPVHEFPDISLDKKPEDPHWWVVKTDDLRSAVNVLVASAAREDHKLNFNMENTMVALSMNSVSGDKSTLHLEALEHGSSEEADTIPMPDEGFNISYPYLLKLLGQYKGDVIRFGLNPQLKKGKPRGGWVRFREDRDGDDYLTLLVWLLN